MVNSAGPLTIAMLLESDGPGGAEIMLLELAKELVARGHRVIPVGIAGRTGWLGDRLRAAGLEPQYITKRYPLDPRWVSDLHELLATQRVDVVHAHEFTMMVYGTAAAKKLGVPIVNTLHGSQTMTQALRRRLALRWAIKRATATVAVSASTRAQLRKDLGQGAEKIGVILNGVPVRYGDREAARTRLGVADEDLLILAVGTLEERKGHLQLLQALNSLPVEQRNGPWRLFVACGRGAPMKGVLDGFIASNGLERRVIASRKWGIPKAIKDRMTGVLVEPGSVGELSQAISRLISDVELRSQLAERAYLDIMSRFTVSAMTVGYEAIHYNRDVKNA